MTSFYASRDGSVDPSQFCIGDGGCVCVGFCESPLWQESVANARCEDPTVSVESIESSLVLAGPLHTVALVTITALSAAAVLAVLLSCRGMLARVCVLLLVSTCCCQTSNLRLMITAVASCCVLTSSSELA